MERIFALVLCIVNRRPDLPDAFVAMPDLSRGVHCSLYNNAWGDELHHVVRRERALPFPAADGKPTPQLADGCGVIRTDGSPRSESRSISRIPRQCAHNREPSKAAMGEGPNPHDFFAFRLCGCRIFVTDLLGIGTVASDRSSLLSSSPSLLSRKRDTHKELECFDAFVCCFSLPPYLSAPWL